MININYLIIGIFSAFLLNYILFTEIKLIKCLLFKRQSFADNSTIAVAILYIFAAILLALIFIFGRDYIYSTLILRLENALFPLEIFTGLFTLTTTIIAIFFPIENILNIQTKIILYSPNFGGIHYTYSEKTWHNLYINIIYYTLIILLIIIFILSLL